MDHSSTASASSSPVSQAGDDFVGTVYVGDHYHELYRSERNTIRFVFRNFESLPHEVGDKISSGTIRCHGHLWSLKLFPRGNSSSTPTRISAFLVLNGNEGYDDGCGRDCSCKVRASFKLRFPSMPGAWDRRESTYDFPSHKKIGRGPRKLALRDDVLDSSKNYLVDGDLTIEVDIRVWKKSPELWTPPNKTFKKDMLHVLESQKYADATFIVQGVKFPVHRNILASRAPTLEDFCREHPPNAEVEIECEKVDPIAFRLLLRFLYGNVLPSADEFNDKARALLCTADYCCCTKLKHAAESILVESLTVDNTAELLVFADAHCCALLKEAATDVFLTNPTKVRASSGWTYVKESNQLLDELVDAMHSRMRDPQEDVNLDRMRVATLRRKLDELGLDADGSRDCLIKRLRGEQAGSD